ncbi:MAG: hypothetical protein MK212_18290 [Saprospiraceae bacterium]|nr:hypothetical protein [Saprospiraceae bacterium]
MKKMILSTFIFLGSAAMMVSCGGGMSDADVQKQAQEKFDKEKAALMEAAAGDCDAKKAEYVNVYLDSLRRAQ